MAVCSNVYEHMHLLGDHGESLSCNDFSHEVSCLAEKTAGFRLRGSIVETDGNALAPRAI